MSAKRKVHFEPMCLVTPEWVYAGDADSAWPDEQFFVACMRSGEVMASPEWAKVTCKCCLARKGDA